MFGIKNMNGIIGIGSIIASAVLILMLGAYFVLYLLKPQLFGEYYD